MIVSNINRRWFYGAGLGLSCTMHMPAGAQTTRSTVEADADTQAASVNSPVTAQDVVPIEGPAADVVVTGSRIARAQLEAPNPITSFNAANIEQSGNTNITNFLLRTPALTGSLDSSQTAGFDSLARTPFGGAGVNALNLRNLGINRTLVLVNGRRHVAGEAGTAAVDIQSIPTGLIERVDVLTGGASAVYGADGVSGVVNFILKRDYEGLSARAQIGISQYGDAGNQFISVIGGRNFSDSRGNVTVAYEYNRDDGLAISNRKQFLNGSRQYLIPNPDDPDDDPTKPDNALQTDVRYAGESPYGAIYFAGDPLPRFRGDGQIYNQGRFIGYYAVGGDSTEAANYTGDLLPRVERKSMNLLTRYEFADAFKVSLEGKFVQLTANTEDTYSGNYPANLFIDNAFIPARIRDAALAFRDANGLPITSFASVRDNFDFGRKGEHDRRRTYRGVIDVSGTISGHASYDLSYTYGRTEVNVTRLRDRLSDRFTASLDAVNDPATGRPTCRSNIDLAAAAALNAFSFTPGPNSGCIPINTFGLAVADPAALAFFQIDHTSAVSVTQQVVNGSISGDFGGLFSLPGGPVQFAFGGEYRRETSRFDPNNLLRDGRFFQFDEPGSVQGIRGMFDVTEAFGELNLPIVKSQRFAETLSVGAAGRYSHYSTIGDTMTWQFNGVYAPVRDISFRGSYGKAVRAPNIGELFTPTSFSRGFVNDPCDISQLDSGTSFRRANCAAVLTALGVNPATYNPLTSTGGGSGGDGTAFGEFRGNSALRAETAITWTAGAVLHPSFLPGLTMSADWYNITLKGAISTPDAQTVANLCTDQPTINNPYCAAITREQGSGRVSGYVVQPQNVSRFRTAGLDVNVAYLVQTKRLGVFDLRLVGGYLNQLDIIATPGAEVDNQVALVGRPRYNAAFSPSWSMNNLSLAYTLRYISRQLRYPRFVTDGQPDTVAPNLHRFKAGLISDLQIQVVVDRQFAFYGGVNNLTDQKPDPDAYDTPVSSIGRYLYIGAKVGL